MSKFSLLQFMKKAQTTIVKHSPEILTGIGIAGMVTTVITAIKMTPKALRLIEDKKAEQDTERLRPLDVIKTTWKCYLPVVITGGLSIGCIVAATSENLRRNAALATAYTLSEEALREYQAKVIEKFGNKKEQEVRDSIAQDRIDRNPVTNNEVIVTGRGTTRCYDEYSGRYFETDIEKIKRTVNELNRRMISDMYISLNEFYDALGLKRSKMGYDLGWNVNRGLIELNYSSRLDEEDVPCLVLDYRIGPTQDYQK